MRDVTRRALPDTMAAGAASAFRRKGRVLVTTTTTTTTFKGRITQLFFIW